MVHNTNDNNNKKNTYINGQNSRLVWVILYRNGSFSNKCAVCIINNKHVNMIHIKYIFKLNIRENF